MTTSLLSRRTAVLPLASLAGAHTSVRNTQARSSSGPRPRALHSAAIWLAVLLALFGAAPAFGQSAVDGFDPNANDFVGAIAVQADGKIIIGGGFTTVGGTNRNHIARLNVDGSVDATFNPGALGGINELNSLAVQADGKILVGGGFTTLGGQSRTNLGRLNGDGSLDTTFTNGANNTVSTLVVQADGKILLGGQFTTLAGQPRNKIGRLNADGTLDTSFTNGASGTVYSLVVQADGKILLGGTFTMLGGQPRSRIGRLNADGSVDATFTNGANSAVFSLAVQADGKILVGGSFATLGGQSRINLGRLNGDGSLDTTFTNGPDSSVEDMAVQADGKILVGGQFTTLGGQPHDHLGRLNNDGSLDTTFTNGADGVVFSLAVQADGKILVGGAFTTLGGKTRNRIGRLHADGSVDATLNPGANQFVTTQTVQADGKILVAGNFSTLGGQARSGIGRLNADGSVNAAFNPGVAGGGNLAYCVVEQADGKILVGGIFSALGGTNRNLLGRLNADGSVDTAFNPTNSSPGPQVYVQCLALQADEKILVGGKFTLLGGQSRTNLGRLNADGTLDTGFTNGANNYVNTLAVQADGRILVGGTFTTLAGQPRSLIGRLEANGNLDTSFNPGASGGGGSVVALAVQADGKILVGGTFTTLGGQSRTNLGKLNGDGSLDTSFTNGANNTVNTLAVQTDGKILVGGRFTTLGGQTRTNIGRLNADGSADATFNPGASGAGAFVDALAVQADGKILVGGFFTNLSGQARTNIGRLTSGGAAKQTLAVNASGVAATWSRSGAGPEVEQVTFEQSSDGTNYTALGSGTRISGGWQLTGLALPAGQNFYLRARGRAVGGRNNGSSGLMESVRQFNLPGTAPRLAGARLAGSGHFQISFPFAFGVNFTALAATNLGLPVTNWTALGPVPEFAPGQFQFTDPTATNHPSRFYQVRSP